jgi:AraC-like DNA-binding protein
VPSVITLVQGQLAAAKNDAERVLALERFLIRQLRRESGTDLLIRDMVGQIKSKHGNVRIAELARRSGLSQSALERRFRRIVGTSPRKLASIVRFRHAIQARAQASRLTDLAYVAGYWDQSHFIKDIVRLSGSAPRALFRQQSLC